MNYSKIKSKFIKQKIKGRKWEASGYIDDLIDIEKSALGKLNCGLGTGYRLKDLEEKYPKEWKIIHLEDDPNWYKKKLAYEKKEKGRKKLEHEKLRKKELKELKESKREWLKAGGKP